MSHELSLLVNIAVAVSIALAGGLLAHRLRQSVIVGYLLAGMVIGPFTPGFSGDREQIASLAEVGVIFLMFALGIEFSLKELARVKAVAIGGTLLQGALTTAAGTGFGLLLGWPFAQSFFFGGVISISSTMVILKTLLDRGEVASAHGRVLLGMLVVQDLVAVVLIVALPRLGAGIEALDDLAFTLLRAVAFIAATVFLGARVVPGFMHRVEGLGSPELFLLTAVALALGTATISALVGLSAALGAFLGGLMLTETEFDHRVVAEVVPMRNLFATLFFVSVGMLIDPRFILDNLFTVLGIALFIMVAKVVLTMVAILPYRLGGKTVVFTSLGMLQIGEFSYVLASAGRAVDAIPATLNSLILTASLVTIVVTPGAFWVAPRVDNVLARLPALGRIFGPHPVLSGAEEGLSDHALVVGYGRVGRHVVNGLREAGLPVAVVESDLHLVQELSSQGIPAIFGDASYASILAAAHPERARLIVVALPDSGATRVTVLNARRANPTTPILARLVRDEDESSLRDAGATELVGPERAGALLLLAESKRVLEAAAPSMPAAPAL